MGIRLFVRSLLPLLMLLQACDGTPFGQRLSESFDSQAGDVSPAGAKADPDTSVVADKGEQQSKVNENDKPTASVSKDGDATESDESERQSDRKSEREQSPAPAVATDSPKPRSTPERTLPYRIMIRLSAADPAAPAEGVTEALRRAGIGFEVETIEKVPASDLNQSSNLQPKPAS